MGIASSEIRKRAIDAYTDGRGTQAEVAQLYGVHLATFKRWLQRYRNTGRSAALPRGHNPPALNKQQMKSLEGFVAKKPGATLEDMRGLLKVSCSLVAIHNALNRLGYRYKKNATRQRARTP